MELINTGGRPIKKLTEIEAIQVEERQPEVSADHRGGRAQAIASVGSVLYEKAISGP